MQKHLPTLRKACITTAVLALALVAAPAASAGCVGNQPIWWNSDHSCTAEGVPPFTSVQDTYVCVSDDPVHDCA